MTVRHCIIHKWGIQERQKSPDRKDHIERHVALEIIREIRRRFGNDVIELAHGDPAAVARYFAAGDTAILSGAERDGCLYGAQKALEKKGVKVLYHRRGSVPYSVTDVPFYDEEPPAETDSSIPFDGLVSVPSTRADSPHRIEPA
jgi:hypothetical protein